MSNLNDVLQDKLLKIQMLVDKGSTDGEKAAAKQAFDRLVKKYNLTDDDLLKVNYVEVGFAHFLRTDVDLMFLIFKKYADNDALTVSRERNKKIVYVRLGKLDAITCHAAYEYYKRHYKKQLNVAMSNYKANKHFMPKSERTKTKKFIKEQFFIRYCEASGLLTEDDLTSSTTEVNDVQRNAMNIGIEAGQYNTQLSTMLELGQ